jgi:hypothetical protein
VASVPGGLELLGAAGFVLTSDDTTDEAALVYPVLPTPEPALAAALRSLERLRDRSAVPF